MATKKETTKKEASKEIVKKEILRDVTKEAIKDSKEVLPDRDRDKKPKDAPVTEKSPTEKYFAGVGRRKTAVATVRIFADPGEGESTVTVNDKGAKEYFPTIRLQNLFLDPIRSVGLENKFRISVHVRGGGPSGQAAAAGLGLARALIVSNIEHRPLLKAGKFLTRDARKVERKKPGLNKARRAPQWSKR